MKRKPNLSGAQIAYAAARAVYDVACKASRDYDAIIDAEGERLGLEVPYAVLPEGNPLLLEAQRRLDVENAARREMRAAAGRLFDWATETTMARMGTEKQKAEIRAMVSTVKAMAHVERPWIDLVKISMQLAA